MTSIRQKESKIPLRVDLKLKNVSKIPLAVNQKPKQTKPKIYNSAEPKLGKTSTVDRSEKSTTEVKKVKKSNLSSQIRNDRNKPTTKGKCKPIQVKGKEDPFCLFQKKIPKTNMQYDDPFKSRVKEKQIKNSKHPSQELALKDRNKATTKKKFKPVEVKEKEDPSGLFEKKIPKINILDDDPFKSSAEDKEIENSKHPSQQNIEFVADERMKKLILSNRELTPTILKSCSSAKLSSAMERPSLYQRLKLIVDPYKQVLEDIKNYDLASEGRRASEMQKNKLHASPSLMERPSLYKRLNCPIDPYKQALADIANYKRASEGRRASEVQRNVLYLSPTQNRDSLYKRGKWVGDPYQEALKSIAKLRIQRQAKSVKKKVTFNLPGKDRSSDSENKDENHAEKPVETIQTKISNPSAFISEKSSRSGTSLSPEFKGIMLLTPDSPKKVTFDSPSKTDQILGDRQISDMHLPEETEEKKIDVIINKTSTSASSSITTDVNNEKEFNDLSPILYQKQKSDENMTIFNREIRDSIYKTTVNPFLNSWRTSEVRQSLFSNQAKDSTYKINPKIFTPQPVSFYPQNNLFESISPEFLSTKTTDILSWAPINTPLVLKSLSKRELSPVCKKLEFKDSPKETKKEAGDSRENTQTFHLQNIMTQQKILDQLANQECCIFLHDATLSYEIRENLQNPIAKILNDGDELHFVPLRRLS